MKSGPSLRKNPIRLRINAELTRALLVDFIRRETLRSGFRRVVLGVSGGIDSAVVLALAVEGLGSGAVLGALLPYRTSHPSSLRDAEAVLRLYRARSTRIDITPMVDAYLSKFPKADRRRRGNKMARERMS